MSGETIWIVMKVQEAAIPIAWRMTEAEADAVRDTLSATKEGSYGPYYFVLPVTNE